MLLKFDISRLPRSPNRFSGTKHWQQYSSERGKWLRDLAVKLWGVERKDLEGRFCEVTIQRYSCVPMDADNAAAACKPVLDSLKELNFIVDDSPHWIYFRAEWKKGQRGKAFTRIILMYP